MKTENTYQGYTNHSTWAVALWVDNDRGLYEDRNLMMRGYAGDANGFAQELKDWLEGMAPQLDGLWSDLLTAALGDVNWYELAETWLTDAGQMGADECTECGDRFDATPADATPVCPSCK